MAMQKFMESRMRTWRALKHSPSGTVVMMVKA